MKSILKLFGMLMLAGVIVVSCKKKEDPKPDDDTVVPEGTVILQGTYSSDLSLDASKKYLLRGFVYVQAPAIMSIPAGTVIMGEKSTKGTLIIERGAKINAVGTLSSPIVFTSAEAPGSRNYGDWGGVIILGKSLENQPGSPIIEGGVDRPFGGTDPADNSGVFKYVRIEFPGIAFSADNEINGLTLGAVGSGTEIDYVQVSYSGDDSFEWFGGTVNCKHLIAYRGWDDEWDTDFGFSGNVQYCVSLRDPDISDISGSNGFESDGDAGGSGATPLTQAQFANVSIYGPLVTSTTALSTGGANYKRALHIRRNSSLSVYNSVFMGYPIGLLVDNNGTTPTTNNLGDNVSTGTMFFRGNVLSGIGTVADTVKYSANGAGYTSTNLKNWYDAGSNKVYTENTSLGLPVTQGSLNMTAPNFLPNGGSVLLSGAVTVPSGLTSETYRGAFGVTDWTSGWANFDCQNTVY